jgi:hypothetical protein
MFQRAPRAVHPWGWPRTKWMRQDFVHVISNPRIMKAFFKWSDFSGDSPASRIYFNYGMPPMIGLIIQDCDYNRDGTPSGLLWGQTWNAGKIGLNTLILDEFEKLLIDHCLVGAAKMGICGSFTFLM